MTDVPATSEIFRLIDKVRHATYDWTTLPEKQRLHDLVVKFKAKKVIASADILWLKEMLASAKGADEIAGNSRKRGVR